MTLQQRIDAARPKGAGVAVPHSDAGAWLPPVVIDRDLHIYGERGGSAWGGSRIWEIQVRKGRVLLEGLTTERLWWRNGYLGGATNVWVVRGACHIGPDPDDPPTAYPSALHFDRLHVHRALFGVEASNVFFMGGSVERCRAEHDQRRITISAGDDFHGGAITFLGWRFEDDDRVELYCPGPAPVSFRGCHLTFARIVLGPDYPPGPITNTLHPDCSLLKSDWRDDRR